MEFMKEDSAPAEANPPEEKVSVEQVPIDWGAVSAYCDEFFKIERNKDEVRLFSEKLAEIFPGDAEALTALAQLPSFFAIEREVTELQMLSKMGVMSGERKKEIWKKRGELTQQLTQYQFLLTHLLVSHPGDTQYLGRFWQVAEKVSKEDHSQGEMSKLRDSILSQTAIYRLMEELGKEPTLSHPTEDAFYAVDLWTSDHQAVQVKGAPRSEEFAFVPAKDEVSFPGVRVEEGNKVIHYNDYITHERQHMRAQLSKLERLEGKDIEGYLIVIPKHMRNSVTGEPAKEIIDAARKQLGV